jgi:nitronate monooxygenase
MDMFDLEKLRRDYPWIQTPLIVGAPMRLIAMADMAVEISKAGMYFFFSPTPTPVRFIYLPTVPSENPLQLPQGRNANNSMYAGGLGFIGAGTDVSILEQEFEKVKGLLAGTEIEGKGRDGTMPIGVGFINWGADMDVAIPLIAKYVSQFAPVSPEVMHPFSFKLPTASHDQF